jgi:hypothetical protein
VLIYVIIMKEKNQKNKECDVNDKSVDVIYGENDEKKTKKKKVM